MNNITLAILMILSTCLSSAATITEQQINDGWKFRQARQGNWHEAKVPGEVHTDLMRANIIPDPFIGQNERSVQWIDKEDWIYETSFVPDEELLRQNNIDIVFKGLDTYADVYLNDSLILKADNMFRVWKFPVKGKLKSGENNLRVYFHSPIKIDLPKFDNLDFIYEAVNDQSENGGIFDKRVSVFARKAGYHYGWDWGPRLVTSGIWRPVSLQGWSDIKIDNLFVETQDIEKGKAHLNASFSIISDLIEDNCRVEIIDSSNNRKLCSTNVKLSEGTNNFNLPFDISKPKLWWCNGLGEPHLYNIRCNVIIDNKIVAQSDIVTGIRTVEVVREKDSEGTSFYFKLNGIPVFAKGANYIPCDNFLSRVTHEVYDKTIKDAVDVNMNMLRVWGGGIYEDDYFYELCDRYGIMVWQDFMFACSMYPAEGAMLDNIIQEAIDNVTRLRHHPSITIWCGNNECLEAWYGWSWKTRYAHQGVDSIIWNQYDTLFHKELPAIISEYSPKSFYWPSSPFSRYDGTAEANNGDFHLWTIWGQSKPIDDYNIIRSRFFSEYGFQSFPTIESVKKYAPDRKDWNINSDVMLAHQRGGEDANNRIKKYLDASYPQPNDFESLLYMTQILQGDAIRIAIESHRRNKPYCMGSLFWQHNDCWPVASWSSRDYYGKWKAQHYFSRKAYDDILVSAISNNDSIQVFVISDRQLPTSGSIVINSMTHDGTIISSIHKRIHVGKDSTKKLSIDKTDLLKDYDESDVIIYTSFDCDNNNYDNISFLVPQKNVKFVEPKISVDITGKAGDYTVTVNSDSFVRAFYMSLDDSDDYFFDDNYFDILPGKKHSVSLKTSLPLEAIKSSLSWTSLYNATHR